MVTITLDQSLIHKLADVREAAELQDASGRTIGYFHPAGEGNIQSPFSMEELERRDQAGGGRPLQDIMKDLQGQ
jgi:hypothetical protein